MIKESREEATVTENLSARRKRGEGATNPRSTGERHVLSERKKSCKRGGKVSKGAKLQGDRQGKS